MMANITIRRALLTDIPHIAALHVASWRATYRGILSDRFLDGPIEAERLAMWERRCAGDPSSWPLILVAEDVPHVRGPKEPHLAALAGFVCAFPRFEPQWGTLIDNVHVAPERKGQGIGGRLLSSVARALLDEGYDDPVHLWVFTDNRAAAAVYDRLGGRQVERTRDRATDGSDVESIRYVWESPTALLHR